MSPSRETPGYTQRDSKRSAKEVVGSAGRAAGFPTKSETSALLMDCVSLKITSGQGLEGVANKRVSIAL
jgi:hypothetical protein